MGARDGETDRGFISSDEGTALVSCGEEGGEPKRKAFHLLAYLRSNPLVTRVGS